MLNKLNFFKNQNKVVCSECSCDDMAALVQYFGKKISLSNIGEGTLGFNYVCNGIEEQPVFLKTHQKGERYKKTLIDEYYFLNNANKNNLSCELIRTFDYKNEEKIWIKMDLLQSIDSISPQQALKLLDEVQNNIVSINEFGSTHEPDLYSIEDLCYESSRELDMLYEKDFFDREFYLKLKTNIENLSSVAGKFSKCICHGDVSNKNIMKNLNNKLLLIDWEDAFWGIPGYDYIYWLTFFSQRKYYSKDVFAYCGLNCNTIIQIVSVIMVLKSAISFYSRAYKNNSLPMQARIEEILKAVTED